MTTKRQARQGLQRVLNSSACFLLAFIAFLFSLIRFDLDLLQHQTGAVVIEVAGELVSLWLMWRSPFRRRLSSN
jgi:hypothetical protein